MLFTTNETYKEITTVDELLTAAKLDWTVEQMDIFREDGLQIANTKANIRKDTNQVLGIVTTQYKPVQNKDAFDFVQDLVGDVTFDNAGEISEGRFVYLQANLDERYLTDYDDNVKCKLVFTNGHNGKVAVKANIVPMVDNKPLNLPIAGAKRSFNANHTKKVDARMKVAKNTLDITKSYLAAVMRETITLGKIAVTDTQVEAFTEALFPVTNQLNDRAYNTVIARRADFINRVDTHTVLGLVLAASDMVQNPTVYRNTKNYDENAYGNFFQTTTLVDTAYKLANKIFINKNI